MSIKAESEALSPGSEQEFRRLRFSDPELERAFRHDYAEKARRYLRVVTGILLIMPSGALIAGVLAGTPTGVVGLPPAQSSAAVWGIQIGAWLLSAGALLLTWSPAFPRLFQPYMAVLGLYMGGTLLMRTLPRPDGIAPLMIASLVVYAIYRLRLVTATLVYWSLIAFFLGYSLWVLHTPGELLQGRIGNVVVANFMGMLAGYTLEYAARRDFLLSLQLREEREKSERLLLNILPEPVAERLKDRPGVVAEAFPEATILFADIVDFTPLSARLTAEGTVNLLNEVFSCFDALAKKHGLEKIKTIGDAYMVVGGLPEPRTDHAEAVVAMGLDMQQEIARFRRDTGEPLALRIGVNTGPVVAGVIGTSKFIYDLWGDTVNLASRMESHGLPNTIQVAPSTYQRIRERYQCEERHIEVKGIGDVTTHVLSEQTAKAASRPA